MITTPARALCCALAVYLSSAGGVLADDNHPDRLLWGDLHLHSNLSFDAFSFGNRGLGPAESYRFARGEAVTSSTGLEAKLRQPLDFLLIADHAEYLGVMKALEGGDPLLIRAEFARRWRAWLSADDLASVMREFSGSIEGTLEHTNTLPAAFAEKTWAEIVAVADEFNEPGRFTTFIGYEWTSMIAGRNLHRVVVFRDGGERVRAHSPLSSADRRYPDELWAALEDYTDATGGAALAIPHNGNLSDGLMFATTTARGEPMTRDYALARQHWEPLYEVTQVKGDAEAHPLLSPADPFADFESWDETDIAMQPRDPATAAASLAGEYARPALQRGLALAAGLGVNPFKFGLIGSTDSHTGLATADSDNFFGKFPDSEPGIERLTGRMGGALWPNRRLVASGYTGVWARDNTREEIFDALRRREVYASTGPRIKVRLFGGWQMPADLDRQADAVAAGYRLGVPMGSDLPPRRGDGPPQFLVMAEQDPAQPGLERVQIVKGWLDSRQGPRERVYDVAWAGARQLDVAGDLPPLPMDAAPASGHLPAGAPALSAVWTDPDFDAGQAAFYYLRVLQMPTPRWTTLEAARLEAPVPEDVPAALQERAYTSPIWYSPPGVLPTAGE